MNDACCNQRRRRQSVSESVSHPIAHAKPIYHAYFVNRKEKERGIVEKQGQVHMHAHAMCTAPSKPVQTLLLPCRQISQRRLCYSMPHPSIHPSIHPSSTRKHHTQHGQEARLQLQDLLDRRFLWLARRPPEVVLFPRAALALCSDRIEIFVVRGLVLGAGLVVVEFLEIGLDKRYAVSCLDM